MREKLIKLLKRTEYQFTMSHSLTVENVADDLIQQGVTVLECGYDCKSCWKTQLCTPKWIPVTERLPYAADDVLLYFGKEGKTQAAGFMMWDGEDQTWHTYSDDGYYTDCESAPTHWMPLPEPPKEES